MHRLLIVVAPLVSEHGLWSMGSEVMVHGLGCPTACGIFLEQGSNPHPLHGQADSPSSFFDYLFIWLCQVLVVAFFLLL